MDEQQTKRLRNDAEDKSVAPTVKETMERLRKTGPTVYKNVAEYLSAAKNGFETVEEIMAATYFKSADMENRFYAPLEFAAFRVTRNNKGEITEIADQTGKGIISKNLKFALAYVALKEKGFKALILGTLNDDRVEILAIPRAIEIMEATSKANKDFHQDAKVLYTPKMGYTVYTPTDITMAILKLGYVALGELVNLLKTLNSLASKEDLREFRVEELVDVQAIESALTSTDIKASRKNFLEALLANKIATMDTDERLTYFSSNVSFTLAHRLGFRLPHTGPFFHTLGNAPIAKVDLESVGKDKNILMCAHVMSQSDYSSVRGDVGKYPVYVDKDGLGGRKHNKWHPLTGKVTMKSQDVAALLIAISKANSQKADSSVATTGEAKASTCEPIDLI